MAESIINSCQGQVLFFLLQTVFNNKKSTPPLGVVVNWRDLFDTACNQGVAAIALDGIQYLFEDDCELVKELDRIENKSVKYDWLGQTLSIEQSYCGQESSAKELSNLLYNQGIRTIVLKGFSFSTLYPRPNHRPSNDLDCYLCGRFEDGNRIMEEMGIPVNNKDYRHSSFSFKGLHVENHKICTTVRGRKQRKAFERYLRGLLENEPTTAYSDSFLEIPCPLFNSLYFLQHAQRHFLRESITLRYVCDWAMIIKSCDNTLKSEEFWRIAKENSLDEFAFSMTRIARYVCGIEAPWIHDFSLQRQDVMLLEDCFKIKENAIIYNGSFNAHIQMVKNMIKMRRKYKYFGDRSMLVELISSIYGVFFEKTPVV